MSKYVTSNDINISGSYSLDERIGPNIYKLRNILLGPGLVATTPEYTFEENTRHPILRLDTSSESTAMLWTKERLLGSEYKQPPTLSYNIIYDFTVNTSNNVFISDYLIDPSDNILLIYKRDLSDPYAKIINFISPTKNYSSITLQDITVSASPVITPLLLPESKYRRYRFVFNSDYTASNLITNHLYHESSWSNSIFNITNETATYNYDNYLNLQIDNMLNIYKLTLSGDDYETMSGVVFNIIKDDSIDRCLNLNYGEIIVDVELLFMNPHLNNLHIRVLHSDLNASSMVDDVDVTFPPINIGILSFKLILKKTSPIELKYFVMV